MIVATALALLGAGLWFMPEREPDGGTDPSASTGASPQAVGTEQGAEASSRTPPAEARAASEQEDKSSLELALKNINLSQGEGGFELWRLKAQWANMQQQDGGIFVEQPQLTYFMGEDGKELHVRSDQGDIAQESHILRFFQNVRVTQDDNILTGQILVYNGTAKTMTFPDGGAFNTKNADGQANRIIWFVNEQRLEAEGNVVVFLEGPAP
ncbi:MAG: LPS export ABC transporter periplasmic protein LptC [Desulfovibrio sp.]|jgi:hypothetical protein|nr:LPS export ABC transporter periplasmic protein LptC [Desulfovibrio sp.]